MPYTSRRITHLVLVENSKHQRSEFAGISLWEELLVNFNKTLSSRVEEKP